MEPLPSTSKRSNTCRAVAAAAQQQQKGGASGSKAERTSNSPAKAVNTSFGFMRWSSSSSVSRLRSCAAPPAAPALPNGAPASAALMRRHNTLHATHHSHLDPPLPMPTKEAARPLRIARLQRGQHRAVVRSTVIGGSWTAAVVPPIVCAGCCTVPEALVNPHCCSDPAGALAARAASARAADHIVDIMRALPVEMGPLRARIIGAQPKLLSLDLSLPHTLFQVEVQAAFQTTPSVVLRRYRQFRALHRRVSLPPPRPCLRCCCS